MNPYLGEIRTFSFNQIPRGWASCSGQIMSIAQNQALFSLLGVTYGGNGVSTFALPNFQGAAMIGQGSNYVMGQTAGTESVTLLANELPMHNHMVKTVNALGSQPLNNADDYLAQISVFVSNPQSALYAVNGYASALGSPVVLAPRTISANGDTTPHENRMPFLTMCVCIALQGVFPSRN